MTHTNGALSVCSRTKALILVKQGSREGSVPLVCGGVETRIEPQRAAPIAVMPARGFYGAPGRRTPSNGYAHKIGLYKAPEA
jgi:hypothetical protein